MNFMRVKKWGEEEAQKDFSLPSSIKSEVQEKGFHLYEWISPKDVKMSIERDFLSVLSLAGIPIAVIVVFVGWIFSSNLIMMFFVFLGLLGVISFFLLVYLSFLAIKKSFLLTKNAYVIVTDSSISLNGKIVKLSDVSKLQDDIKKTSSIFEEDLFGESRLDATNGKLMKQVYEKALSGYTWIFKGISQNSGRKTGQLSLLILILYTLYLLFMLVFYMVAVATLWIFGLLLTWVNKLILLQTGHEVLTINDLFSKVDAKSKIIHDEKGKLLTHLENAKNNEWQDSLLLDINNGITKISGNTNDAIAHSTRLKMRLEVSKYKEMFNFSLYNSWIKKQIFDPLNEIYNLLKINLDILMKTKSALEKQITQTKDTSLQVPLELQKKRIELRLEDIKKYMGLVQGYMNKIV